MTSPIPEPYIDDDSFAGDDRRRRWQDYSQVEFAAALAADSDTKCTQCPHTKGEHYSAGPQCSRCDCPGLVVPVGKAVLDAAADRLLDLVDGLIAEGGYHVQFTNGITYAALELRKPS